MLSCDFKTDEKKTAKLKAGSTIETDKNMVDQKDIFKEKVIVFVSKEPDLESNVLDIQDFIENGKAFIPVFSSLEKLKESTQGADLPFPKYQIDGLFLLSIMNGNETLRVNPTLSDEAFFRASELKEYYKADIEKLLKKILSEDE
ncbi:MAG: SseB family protein [Allomuricauda sp.]